MPSMRRSGKTMAKTHLCLVQKWLQGTTNSQEDLLAKTWGLGVFSAREVAPRHPATGLGPSCHVSLSLSCTSAESEGRYFK